MKVVILAGGLGTRISEETSSKPKPMVEVGGKPLLWHIMKLYSNNGLDDFVICLGYKGYVIKEFFLNYFHHMSDMTVNIKNGETVIHQNHSDDWRITLVDTGAETMTGGRLKLAKDHIGDETFCMTYGDGLADINIMSEIVFHKQHGKLATVAAVRPPGRFGVLTLDKTDEVVAFDEKPDEEFGWINGGFFVLEPGVFEFIDDENTSWELSPLQNLSKKGELVAFRHPGFWQACDTLRDKIKLEKMYAAGDVPWLST